MCLENTRNSKLFSLLEFVDKRRPDSDIIDRTGKTGDIGAL